MKIHFFVNCLSVFSVPFLSQAKLVEARTKNTSIPTDTKPALTVDGDYASGEPAQC